jgi:hypothetical protein
MSAATTDLPTGTAVEPTRRSGAGILALATVVGVLLGFAIEVIDGVRARSDHPEVLWLAGLMEAGQASEIEAMRGLSADLDRA